MVHFKTLVFVLIAASSFAASATTKVDRDTCTLAYDAASRYRAKANGKLYQLHKTGVLNFEEYSYAHNKNTRDTFDYMWRINRNSRVGTAEECMNDAAEIKWLIDSNMERYPR